jgi:HlyD family secretion protein
VKKPLLFVAITAALAAGAYWRFGGPQHPVLTDKNVTVAPFLHGTMRDVVSATGILEPRDQVLVGSEIPGTIQTLHVRVGDVVSEGAELATLDDRKYRLKLEEAQNGLAAAKAGLAQAMAGKEGADTAVRVQKELAESVGFRTDLDQAMTAAKIAEAGLLVARSKLEAAGTLVKEARLALDQAVIRVPAASSQGPHRDYVVLDRKVNVGQAVGPMSGPLFILAGDIETMEVHAQVAEGDVSKIKVGQPAVFTVTGFDDTDFEFRGAVRVVRPLGNKLGGAAVTFDTVVDVKNQRDPATGDWRLRPGMTAAIDVIRGEHKNVWKIPEKALNFKFDKAYFDPPVQERLAEWRKRPDAGLWTTAWTWDADKKTIAPLFVRVLGTNANGEPGMKDAEGNEVLEWEPGRMPSDSSDPPKIITDAPPAHAPGFMDRPANLKVS